MLSGPKSLTTIKFWPIRRARNRYRTDPRFGAEKVAVQLIRVPTGAGKRLRERGTRPAARLREAEVQRAQADSSRNAGRGHPTRGFNCNPILRRSPYNVFCMGSRFEYRTVQFASPESKEGAAASLRLPHERAGVEPRTKSMLPPFSMSCHWIHGLL